MDLTNPIRSVIPSAQGDVLSVLARTEQPLSGRRVAMLTDGRVSQKGTNLALRSLVASGLVLVEEHPPAKLYRLNRRHLAATSIEQLARLRGALIDALRAQLAGWELGPWGAWLFGSAARGDGGTDSDIDVLLVRKGEVHPDDPVWLGQIEGLEDDVRAWTGNRCAVAEFGAEEFRELMAGDDRLARDLRTEALALTSRRLPRHAVASGAEP